MSGRILERAYFFSFAYLDTSIYRPGRYGTPVSIFDEIDYGYMRLTAQPAFMAVLFPFFHFGTHARACCVVDLSSQPHSEPQLPKYLPP